MNFMVLLWRSQLQNGHGKMLPAGLSSTSSRGSRTLRGDAYGCSTVSVGDPMHAAVGSRRDTTGMASH